MKTYRIRITCPDCEPIQFEGLFASHWDAFNAAIDHAPHALCGISTRRLS